MKGILGKAAASRLGQALFSPPINLDDYAEFGLLEPASWTYESDKKGIYTGNIRYCNAVLLVAGSKAMTGWHVSDQDNCRVNFVETFPLALEKHRKLFPDESESAMVFNRFLGQRDPNTKELTELGKRCEEVFSNVSKELERNQVKFSWVPVSDSLLILQPEGKMVKPPLIQRWEDRFGGSGSNERSR